MKNKAYPYVRFSSTAQESGDSIRRQENLINEFVKKYDLELDESLALNDYGKSAYRGANIKEGDLGKFITLVEARKIKRGSYLLIENFDRFSRMQVRKALLPFLGLINSGINIVTLDDGKIFDEEVGPGELLGTIISMERANAESVRKGRLVAAAKRQAKQDVIDGKRKTLWKWGTPKWMDLSLDKNEFILIEERVELIKRILQWVIDGFGMGSIVRKIESEGIAPWSSSSGINTIKKTPKCWYNSQISRIIKNRALIGELELKQKDKHGHVLPFEVVKDFFPKIVSEEYFFRVQNALRSRSVTGIKAGGRKGKTLTNLFSKLIVCGYSLESKNNDKYKCEGNNQLVVYSNNDKRDHKTGKVYRQRYLKCAYAKANANRCRKCRKYIQYDFFEKAFLTHVRDISTNDIFGHDDDQDGIRQSIVSQLESRSGKLQDAKKSIEELSILLDNGVNISELLNRRGLACEVIIKEETEAINRLEISLIDHDEKTSKKSDFTYNLKSLISAQGDCSSDVELFELREKISSLLKEVIDKIELYTSGTLSSGQFIDNLPKDERATAKLVSEAFDKLIEPVSKLSLVVVHYRLGKVRRLLLDTRKEAENSLVLMTAIDEN